MFNHLHIIKFIIYHAGTSNTPVFSAFQKETHTCIDKNNLKNALFFSLMYTWIILVNKL